MSAFPCVVIGAGHAGLAVSQVLGSKSIDHIVLERERIASKWRTERWDSFTLLTPNWATWLPDWHYTGTDPHGFMGRSEIVSYFEGYADSFDAPVREGIEVDELSQNGDGTFRIVTESGRLAARTVVVATGPFQKPKIPSWAPKVPDRIQQLHSSQYRNPDQLPAGATLVIGSGPSGQQIAEDLHRQGKRVFLSVGRHRRVPRRYRGRDYYWWLELGGFYEPTSNDVDPSRRQNPVAPALTGFGGGQDLNLRRLSAEGVTLLGRSVHASQGRLELDSNLKESLRLGDRAYDDFAAWVESRLHRFDGLYHDVEPAVDYPDPDEPPTSLDLSSSAVGSIIWATGYAADHTRWIQAPVFDDAGQPIHTRGETTMPGLYFLGLSWLHRLRSPFIRGAEEDARHVAELVFQHLAYQEAR